MSEVEVFEPAQCSNGRLRTDIDQQLVIFSADMDFVRSREW